MKLKRLLLGVAVVALMTACGGGKTETSTTEATVSETTEMELTDVTEGEQAVAEQPVSQSTGRGTKASAPSATAEEKAPQVDPCEAKVKAFEQYVDKLSAAQKDKSKGPQQLKAFGELLKEAEAQENAVKDCAQGEFKTRVQNAVMLCKKIRTTK